MIVLVYHQLNKKINNTYKNHNTQELRYYFCELHKTVLTRLSEEEE